MDDAARRGLRARHLRPGAGRRRTSRPRPRPPWSSPRFARPYRGRSTPVNAWWGTFDLAVSLFSGPVGRPAVERLHHAQLRERRADRDRLVARRRPLPTRRLLRIRVSRTPTGLERRHRVTGGRALGRRARRVHPRLGRRSPHRRPARHRRGVRAIGDPTCLRRVQLGRRSGGERRLDPSATHLSHGRSLAANAALTLGTQLRWASQSGGTRPRGPGTG